MFFRLNKDEKDDKVKLKNINKADFICDSVSLQCCVCLIQRYFVKIVRKISYSLLALQDSNGMFWTHHCIIQDHVFHLFFYHRQSRAKQANSPQEEEIYWLTWVESGKMFLWSTRARYQSIMPFEHDDVSWHCAVMCWFNSNFPWPAQIR